MPASAESPVRLAERPMRTQNRVGSSPGFLHRVLTTANSFSRLAYAIGKLAWNVGSFLKGNDACRLGFQAGRRTSQSPGTRHEAVCRGPFKPALLYATPRLRTAAPRRVTGSDRLNQLPDPLARAVLIDRFDKIRPLSPAESTRSN